MRLLFSFLITALSLTSFNLYQQKPLEQSIADGKEIYADFCLQCHMASGEYK